MPEGPTIHHIARHHRALFARDALAASSPQGRFADGAARIDGRELDDVVGCGKHLFYDFGEGLILHVHLGLRGRFFERAPEQPGAPAARLRLEGRRAIVELVAPMTCEIVDKDAQARIVGELGPDPLVVDVDWDRVHAAVAKSRRPIGALLLDQMLFNGVGNALRAEVLHEAKLDPRVAGCDLERRAFDDVVQALLRIMRASAEDGVVASRPPSPSDPHDEDARRAVYKRERCADCGATTKTFDLGGRPMWWCGRCQGKAGRRGAETARP